MFFTLLSSLPKIGNIIRPDLQIAMPFCRACTGSKTTRPCDTVDQARHPNFPPAHSVARMTPAGQGQAFSHFHISIFPHLYNIVSLQKNFRDRN